MGTDKCDIIAGIHRSVAHRVTGLAHRIGVVPDVVMTGGVAQNQGVVDALEAELGVKICTSPLTQYNGALGAPDGISGSQPSEVTKLIFKNGG